MLLLDLPLEILISIYEHLGPAELRRSVDNLLLSKRLYEASHRTYLVDLQLSTLRLSTCGLEWSPPVDSPLFGLIRHQVKHLSIQLVNHPSKKVSSTLWADSPELPGRDNEECDDPYKRFFGNGEIQRVWKDDQQIALQRWRLLLNQQLKNLAKMLPLFTQLQSFALEAACDCGSGAKWDYLYADTFALLVRSLPVGLSAVHLDIGGTELIENEAYHTHICQLLGERMKDFRCVRLRMRKICPAIFQACGGTSLLEKMIIRMILPKNHGSYETADAAPCDTTKGYITQLKEMISASWESGDNPELSMLRISCRDPVSNVSAPCVINCIGEAIMYPPPGVYWNDEDGRHWDFREEWESLRFDSGLDWLFDDDSLLMHHILLKDIMPRE